MPINSMVLSRFLSPVFIETGTLDGDGVRAALEAGFGQVYTIDTDHTKYEAGLKAFANNPKVHLIYGDSRLKISEAIAASKNRAITFWLDAHGAEVNEECSLLGELAAIRNTKVRTHKILIDDFRTMEREFIQKVLSLLLEINSRYRIELVNGTWKPFDIIAAH